MPISAKHPVCSESGINNIQGKTHWADSACADCPGFFVLGAAPAQAPPPSSQSLRLFPWASILLHGGPWTSFACICCPQLPLPPVQKRDAQHMFLKHGGAHAETWGLTILGGTQKVSLNMWTRMGCQTADGHSPGLLYFAYLEKP